MFTGIIEETGSIKKISKKVANILLEVKAKKALKDIKIGQSISINGVCLTVIDFSKESFTVEATEETQEKSNIRDLKENDKVNLERTLPVTGRFDGHFVAGHIDGTGKLVKVSKNKDSVLLTIEINETLGKYVVNKGSIAVDGISLTVVKLENNVFTVNIIPHTFENTNLKYRKAGDKLNIEFDIIGKYIEKMLSVKSNITMEFLKEKGF